MTALVRILWVVNIPLPAACHVFGLQTLPLGGWLSAMTLRLAKVPGVQLGVAMRAPVQELRSADVDGIRYYALPQSGKGGLDARAEDCATVGPARAQSRAANSNRHTVDRGIPAASILEAP